MYTDLMDTVNTSALSNQYNSAKAESFFFHALLNGNRPTLSLPQSVDSSVTLKLATQTNTRKYFLQAIENGYIRISLFNQMSCLQEYVINILNDSISQSKITFKFSSLPFLYNEDKYSTDQLLKIYEALRNQLNYGSPFFSLSIDSDDKNALEEYVETIRTLNQALNCALRKAYNKIPNIILPESSNINLSLSHELKSIINKCLQNPALDSEVRDSLMNLQKKCISNRRTDYYSLLEQYTSEYKQSTLNELKSMIDYSYNRVIASSIYDKEYANLNIPSQYAALAASATDTPATNHIFTQELSLTSNSSNYLTWENLLDILIEVNALKDHTSNSCSWNEALNKYIAHQSRLPFKQGTKYLGITALTCMVSSIPLVGSVVCDLTSNMIWSIVCDAAGDALKKPSLSDVIKECTSSYKKAKLLGSTVSHTSIGIN